MKARLFLLSVVFFLVINTKAQCVLDFSYSVSGSTVTFTNISTGYTSWGSYSFDFGDGNYSVWFTTMNHMYTYAGTYNVCWQGEDHPSGCGYDSICHSVTTTLNSIFEYSSIGNINCYPNPFSSATTLQTSIELHNATLTVDNCLGQTVSEIKNISGQTITFTRDNLPTGLYFARLIQDNQLLATVKLVITD